MKKTKVIIILILFIFAGSILSNRIIAQGISPEPGIFPTITKAHVVANDVDDVVIDTTNLKANVLFLIDVGSAMLFTPKGKLPNWDAALKEAGNNWTKARAIVNEQMKECTFGSGGLPGTGPYTSVGRNRAGRDLDDSNNDRSNPDNYYNTGVLGYPPNDSRLYQMKLVLWRMLEYTDLFDKLRFALATTYQEENIANTYRADFYKVAPYDKTNNFPNGRGPSWATSGIDGYSYNDSQEIQWGIDQNAYSDPKYRYASDVWFNVHRSYLRIPFGENTARHLNKFKKLINGVENTNPENPKNTDADFRTIDPEIIADGRTPLANSIFPATGSGGSIQLRNTFLSKGKIYYSSNTNAFKQTQGFESNTYHWFGKGSGEAVGTALDFFSPPVAGKGASSSAVNVLKSQPGNFPIKSHCEANWLVVFTAGDDSSNYKAYEAVRDLYNYSKNNDLVRLKNPHLPVSLDNLETVRLHQPIRTMVIGFVDHRSEEPTIKDLIKTLNLMADYGDDGVNNTSAEAFFANNVPELLNAMRHVLLKITSELRASSVPVMLTPKAEDGELGAYAPGYKRQSEGQWQGYLDYYLIEESGDKDIKLTWQWEFGNELKKYIGNNNKEGKIGERNLYTWNWTTGQNSEKILLPDKNAMSQHKLAPLMGLTTADLSGYTTGPHPSNLMIRWMFGMDYNAEKNQHCVKETLFTDMGNSGYSLVGPLKQRTMDDMPGYNDWAKTMNARKRTLFLHSNDGLLHAVDLEKNKASGTWGKERWAFIPPNVLANKRLAGLKFVFTMEGGKQKCKWINDTSIASYLTDGSVRAVNLPLESNGSKWGTLLTASMGRGGAGLYAIDVTDPEQAPKFLWAIENDLYSYHSNGEKGAVHEWSSKNTIRHVSTAYSGYGNNSVSDYRLLSFNAPAPAVGTTFLNSTPTNIGVLSAGMHYSLDLQKNGTFGSAVYIMDPVTGKLLHTFSSLSALGIKEALGDVGPHVNPIMGMMVTPPILLYENASIPYVTGFLVADNRGQIFKGRFVDTNNIFVDETTKWSLQRVATIKKDTEVTSADNFCMPNELSIMSDSEPSLWLFGGTADVLGRKIGEDILNKTDIDGKIHNKEQLLFGFKSPSNGEPALSLRSDSKVTVLNRDVKEDKINPSEKKGWIIPLAPADPKHRKEREYLSARTLVYGDRFYASTFIPGLSVTNLCAAEGNSRFYMLDAKTGEALWDKIKNMSYKKTKYLDFVGIKVGGMTVSTIGDVTRLFLSIVILDDTGFDTAVPNSKVTANEDYKNVNAILHSSTSMSIELPKIIVPPSSGVRNVYWRKVFR